MRAAVLILLGCLIGQPGSSSPAFGRGAEPAKDVDYGSQVKPILMKHCASCHGARKPRGGLRLDTAAAAIKGGKGGPAIVPGEAGESELIASVRGEGSTDRMPLNRPPLNPAEIEVLARWIDQGAKHPAAEPAGDPSAIQGTHWAFVPPWRVSPPATRRPDWRRNPIDAFILSRLEQEGLAPSGPAERATLLRRVSLDLIGRPPTPAERARFLADRDPDAYERCVDRLLASPEYGVRWAHPWLDAARYADSNGYSIDAPRSIWKYRDWVVDALNADLPFDQFAIDQIAGDLRPNASVSDRIATGFQRNTPTNEEGGIDLEQFRVDSVIDRANTVGTVFLGLTVGCAQCHDHKFDPITQREYYRLFAFFDNVDEPTMPAATPDEESRRAEAMKRVEAFFDGLAARVPDIDRLERAWEDGLPVASRKNPAAEIDRAWRTPRDRRTPRQKRLLYEVLLLKGGVPALRAERERLVALQAAVPPPVTTMVVRERRQNPRKSHILIAGDFTRKGQEVTPGVPAVLPGLAGDREASPGTAAPDRMALACWLVDRRNPLTARVAVNRIWQAYFGRGLVETDNDFGTQGTPPSHPELLDWLACAFMDAGWSQKAIHRLIVTSATYRQASRVRPEGAAKDPDNRLLWRQARLRLDAELIRDSALAAAGLLSDRIGGPSVFPPQPDGVFSFGQIRRQWHTSEGTDRYRRSLYTFLWRATPYPLFTTFDAPGRVQTCTRRLRSDTPLQALALLNDEAFTEIARALAARLVADPPPMSDDRARIAYAFVLCLGRPPAEGEVRALEDVLEQERKEDAGPESRSAPWLTVARVLLNLDEFVTRE